MDIKDLNKIAAACRKHGIKQLSYGDVSITFDHSTAQAPKVRQLAAESSTTEAQEDVMSEEDVLFWSSAGIPE